MLGLSSDDLSKMTVFARSDRGAEAGPAFPFTIPAPVTRAWVFDIIDDLDVHPLEANRPAATSGARSSLRLPIRFDDRVIGGLGFLSFERAKYTSGDVAVGRRLADQVAVGLSHYDLAERLADQARRNEELRARTTNIELLEEFLGRAGPGVFPRLRERSWRTMRPR